MLAGETRSAYQALTAEGGVLEKLQDAQVSIDKIAGVDGTVETQQKAVREAYFLLEDVGHELARYQASIDFSEDELEVRQTRLSALQGIMRGYGPTMDEVFATFAEANQLIASYDSCDELLAEAKQAREEAEDRLVSAADALAAAREEVAPRFSAAVTAQMARLLWWWSFRTSRAKRGRVGERRRSIICSFLAQGFLRKSYRLSPQAARSVV